VAADVPGALSGVHPTIAPLVLAALVLTSLAEPADARRLRQVCTDGDRTCDVDAACDGRCTFAFCRVLCLVPPCPDVFGPCDRPDAELLVDVPLRRGGKAPGRRRVGLGRGLHAALRCVPETDRCKPPLTTGCRSDLPPEECAAHDGEHARRGLAPEPSCHCRTQDAGTPCDRATDCQGLCLAELGGGDGVARCSPHLLEFGCFALRDDEGGTHALCID
jgi:hypothetical protein